MFFEKSDMIPRTYSIKSYKRRERHIFRKILKYILFLVLFLGAFVVIYLSAEKMV